VKRTIITFILAAIALLAVAGPASAQMPAVPQDPQWQSWALYWEGEAEHERAGLIAAAAMWEFTLDPKMPDRSAFIVWPPSILHTKPCGLMQWRRYGTACKRKALAWAARAEKLRLAAARL
jgi:hypothetical protein